MTGSPPLICSHFIVGANDGDFPLDADPRNTSTAVVNLVKIFTNLFLLFPFQLNRQGWVGVTQACHCVRGARDYSHVV